MIKVGISGIERVGKSTLLMKLAALLGESGVDYHILPEITMSNTNLDFANGHSQLALIHKQMAIESEFAVSPLRNVLLIDRPPTDCIPYLEDTQLPLMQIIDTSSYAVDWVSRTYDILFYVTASSILPKVNNYFTQKDLDNWEERKKSLDAIAHSLKNPSHSTNLVVHYITIAPYTIAETVENMKEIIVEAENVKELESEKTS